MNDNNYIWIFGENRAESACENSFNFWKYCLSQDDGIDGYLVLKKNEHTSKVYDSLSKKERDYVLWHNSKAHKKVFDNADMCYISDSFEDVCPTKGRFRPKKYPIEKPLIFLQKDTNSIFNSRFTGESQNNNIFRFCVYDKENLEIFKQKNNFKDYQLRYVKFPLKFDSDFISQDESAAEKNLLIWAVEWRYYESIRSSFIDNLVNVLHSSELNSYLKNNNLTLKVYLHRYYKKELFKQVYDCENEFIKIIDTNVVSKEDIIHSQLLITDYSSYAYDFTLIGRPVILYQPDFDFVKNKHQFLINEDEINNVKTEQELISAITSQKEIQNPIFEIWDEGSLEELRSDDHIRETYDYFCEKQKNKITFIGYNFFGAGGTVSSTKAMAEGLMQKDYFVELYSILRTNANNSKPYGINFTYGFYRNTSSFKEKLKYKLFKLTRNYGKLSHEQDVSLINPYSNYHLKRKLKNIKSRTVVSTRETMHLYVEETKSKFVEDKLYFFHAQAKVVDVMYPGLIDKLKEKKLNKAIFVTDANRLALKELFDYDDYNNYKVIGNALEESKIIPRDEIKQVPKKDKYYGIYLIRFSAERKDDLNNLVEFAKYLKSNNISHIVIDLFGGGKYADEFMEIVYDNNLDNIINYRSRTNDPFGEIKSHDFMADFSLNHSFGMTYIEGVLAGTKVFGMENEGSREVLKGIDNSYIQSYEWLVNQINDLPNLSLEELQGNYDIILSRFSQQAVSERFLDFLD